jgi:DNA-damage-inducible protein J
MLLTEIVRARVEPELKKEATAVLEQYGLDLSTAVRLFMRTVVARKSIAFALTPNPETVAAMQEANGLKGSKQSAEELFKELETGIENVSEKTAASAASGKEQRAPSRPSLVKVKAARSRRESAAKTGVKKRQHAEAI